MREKLIIKFAWPNTDSSGILFQDHVKFIHREHTKNGSFKSKNPKILYSMQEGLLHPPPWAALRPIRRIPARAIQTLLPQHKNPR